MALNEEKIWDYLIKQIRNNYGVAGLMGNLYAESGLMPNNLQNTGNKKLGMTDDEYVDVVDNGLYTNFVNDSQGFGLAQWTFWSLKRDLLDYANSVGKSIGDLDMQLEFLVKELSKDYPSVWQALLTATSVADASNAVLLGFERPANQSESVQVKRAEFGKSYYDKYSVIAHGTNGGNNVNAAEKLLATAKAEVGYLEKKSNAQLDNKTENAGTNNWTKYARDLDKLGVYNFPKNGYAWCDMFVDWCFVTTFGLEMAWRMTNQPMGGCGAGCTYSAQYYANVGRFFTSDPQPGDQIFFKDSSGGMGHTGIVEKVANGRVYTIEGNTSSDAGVVANGGSVNDKSYSLSYAKIGGYGRPDWSLVQSNYEEDEDMDVNRFKELWVEMRKELQDNDAGNWSADSRQWCIDNGLIQGGGNGADGQPNYMWADVLTREQMAALLYRFAKLMGKA